MDDSHESATYFDVFAIAGVGLRIQCPSKFTLGFAHLILQFVKFRVLLPLLFLRLYVSHTRFQIFFESSAIVGQCLELIQSGSINGVNPLEIGRSHEELVLVFRLAREKLLGFLLIQNGYRILHLNVAENVQTQCQYVTAESEEEMTLSRLQGI